MKIGSIDQDSSPICDRLSGEPWKKRKKMEGTGWEINESPEGTEEKIIKRKGEIERDRSHSFVPTVLNGGRPPRFNERE